MALYYKVVNYLQMNTFKLYMVHTKQFFSVHSLSVLCTRKCVKDKLVDHYCLANSETNVPCFKNYRSLSYMYEAETFPRLLTLRNYVTKTVKWENYLSLKHPRMKKYVQFVVDQYDEASKANVFNQDILKLTPLARAGKLYLQKESEMSELSSIIKESVDKELIEMAVTDQREVQIIMDELEEDIIQKIDFKEPVDETDVILELNPGVGGQEAMLFTADILKMYSNYASYRGWTFEIIHCDYSEQGGIRKATMIISGQDVYRYLKYEGGVHRIQRVPRTEKSGRVHTSTMTVSVLPQPSEIDVVVDIQKDLKITTMKAGGPGGQHVNKTESAVRIFHISTGLQVECQASRSQIQNRETALKILRSKLFEMKLKESKQEHHTKRKLQVGSGGRSEKIRTYNFQRDRMTDHRINKSINNIRGILSGGKDLDLFIDSLLTFEHEENVLNLLDNCEKYVAKCNN